MCMHMGSLCVIIIIVVYRYSNSNFRFRVVRKVLKSNKNINEYINQPLHLTNEKLDPKEEKWETIQHRE